MIGGQCWSPKCRNRNVNPVQHVLIGPCPETAKPVAPTPLPMVRLAAILVIIGGTLVAGPAVAQFGNIFGGGDSPPRPPADVPNGPFPPQPPPVGYPSSQPYPEQAPAAYPRQAAPGYPGQPPAAYPSQAPAAYPSGQPAYPGSAPGSAVEAQPLPPPPDAAVPPPSGPAQGYPQRPLVPTQRAIATPPPPAGAPGQPAANAPPAPAAAEAAPEDDTVVEAPTQHIENRRAVFAGLDKITGRTISFDAAIGETVQFGALQVTPRACYTRPPTEATNTDAFVEVDEVTLQGDIKRIFTGWMFASSPGLHAVEHPIYDVWLTDCASPIQTSLAEPAAQPAPTAPAPAHRAAPRQRPLPRPAPAVEPEPQD